MRTCDNCLRVAGVVSPCPCGCKIEVCSRCHSTITRNLDKSAARKLEVDET